MRSAIASRVREIEPGGLLRPPGWPLTEPPWTRSARLVPVIMRHKALGEKLEFSVNPPSGPGDGCAEFRAISRELPEAGEEHGHTVEYGFHLIINRAYCLFISV